MSIQFNDTLISISDLLEGSAERVRQQQYKDLEEMNLESICLAYAKVGDAYDKILDLMKKVAHARDT